MKEPKCSVCQGRRVAFRLPPEQSIPDSGRAFTERSYMQDSLLCPRCKGTGEIETLRSETRDVPVGTYHCLICDSDVKIAYDVIVRLRAGDFLWECARDGAHSVVPAPPVGTIPMKIFIRNQMRLRGL